MKIVLWTHIDKLRTSKFAYGFRMRKSGFGLLIHCTNDTTMVAVHHPGFLKTHFLTTNRVKKAIICVTLPNFVMISPAIAVIWRFIHFFAKWWPSIIFDWSDNHRDHPWRVLGGLSRCAKFGGIWCSSFDNTKCVWLENPIHSPK